MPERTAADIPRSNLLYSAIVATVAATRDRQLTVRDIAARVGVSAEVAAQCIALHRYLRTHADDPNAAGSLSIPAPADFTIPDADEVIDAATLGLR